MDLHPDYWCYFGIEWEGQYYTYTSLPFGLASACWAFTKLTRELLHKWRRLGHRCGGYLDDALHCHQNRDALQHLVNSLLVPDFILCGFILNMEKCHLNPMQRAEYLGMFIDTIRGCFEVPESKRQIIVNLIQRVLQDRYQCSVHLLEILAGNLASMHWAFGPLSRLMTMSIYTDINSSSHRNCSISLSETTVKDLNFWLCGFDRYNGFKPIWEPRGFNITIFTDAAGINLKFFGGWAGWTRTATGIIQIAKGVWSEAMTEEHSTMQELQAIYNTLQSFNPNNELAGKRILIKTDSQAVFFIINKAGSRDPFVHDLCKEFTWYCIHKDISLKATWIPRELNEFADFYSKLTDSGDWKLNPQVFDMLERKWGKFEIDLFASYDNHQTNRYYSLYFTPTCEGVDAFNFTWGRSGWCNPPFSLIAKVIAHGQYCGSRFCLICPYTPSAPWWPSISPNGIYFQSFVRDSVVLHRSNNLFFSGRTGHAYAGHAPRWQSLALLLDFQQHQQRRAPLLLPAL
jgi:ribonuclease HI